MNPVLVASFVIFAGCISGSSLAMPPLAKPSPGLQLAFVQDKRDLAVAALDARLEAAAVTAALIRAHNVILVLAEQNLDLMSALHRISQQDKDATLQREAEIRGAMDTALESYLRLIGQIENSSSLDDINARIQAVDRAMGFRGQSPVKTALPAILLHVRLIRDGSAPSRDIALKDILSLSNQ